MVHDNKNSKTPIYDFFIYLVSDATGTTLQGLSRAALSQFEGIDPKERFWPMIRSEMQLDRAIADIQKHPGPVLFTFVDKKLRRKLQAAGAELDVPCMPVLDPILRTMSSYLGLQSKGVPGLQHSLDEAYFDRIDAVDFALSYDDGRNLEGLEEADVILVGVSRTSKTPTCIFLARRGIRAANIPLVPNVPFPEQIAEFKKPLIIGLTESPKRLENLRRSRLHADDDHASYMLILASKSAARQTMLKNAGIEFTPIPANIDEENILITLEKDGASATNIALHLAKEKALLISNQNKENYVIGSDQVLSMNEKIYSKANNKAEAIERLNEFQGQEHYLTSAVCVAKNGEVLWHKTDAAALKMKDLDSQAIEKYSKNAGDVLTSCVGCYAIEGIGIQLFNDVRGDYFTIMGMPLLPLLNFLDGEGALS